MAIRTGIIFCTLLLGSLAVPVPEDDRDMSFFFENTVSGEVPSGRIVGGTIAADGSHPWMVAFTIGAAIRMAHCGASILTRRTVLTAAHCIIPVRVGSNVLSYVRLNVGTNIRNDGGQSLSANRNVIHELYDGNTIKYDIGTLYTSTDIIFNDVVYPIRVTTEHVGGGVPVRVAGWGLTGVQDFGSLQLREVDLLTVDPNQCVEDVVQAAIDLNVRAPPVDPNLEICTFVGVGRGTCRGDSGGPLVHIENRHQVGLVSWGFPCAVGAPDVYVRLSSFQSWILANTV